jgi:hypothetical protein
LRSRYFVTVEDHMRLNMGCGFNKKQGYVNVDKFAQCQPDLQMDLEVFPWKFETGQAQEVVFIHSLEHMGQDADTFLEIMKELYRICRNGATVEICVPHPRHDHFIGDPTHVRIVTPEMLTHFSKRENENWKKIGASNTPFGLYLDVNFEIRQISRVLEPKYLDLLQSNKISTAELKELEKERNNVVSEIQITLEVIK